ncbi:NnrS family protein [Pseudoalteromonas 'SMAR']|uniref:NnrS family protein n=1 Tax=Pseudoalteromonas 'SMAR' TaxID=3416908 RepID=UPI003AF2F326
MSLLQLQEPNRRVFQWRSISTWPLFMLAFRPLFLLAASLSVVSISVWALILTGNISWHAPYPATFWHVHEMLFGVVAAVVAGFLLTAAKNWTQQQTLNGKALLLLCCVWLAARLSFFINDLGLTFTLGLQMLFWLLVIINLSHVIITAQSRHNRVFIFITALLCSCNALFLILLRSQDYQLVSDIAQSSLMAYLLLIGVVGGRVIPFFIARGTNTPQAPRSLRLDRSIFIVALAALPSYLWQMKGAPHFILSTVLAILALLHLKRACDWFNRKLIKVPLLWSLYLSYLTVALGLLLLAYSNSWASEHVKSHLHLVAITGMGLMILAMMSRVTLGHTGRALETGFVTTVAYSCIATSGLLRALLGHFISPHLSWLLSALVWVLGFALFLYTYAPMLLQKRIDGHVG